MLWEWLLEVSKNLWLKLYFKNMSHSELKCFRKRLTNSKASIMPLNTDISRTQKLSRNGWKWTTTKKERNWIFLPFFYFVSKQQRTKNSSKDCDWALFEGIWLFILASGYPSGQDDGAVHMGLRASELSPARWRGDARWEEGRERGLIKTRKFVTLSQLRA